jgi:hypothetical protein
MQQQLNILVNYLGPDQFTYSLTRSLSTRQSNLDVIIFYENITRFLIPPIFPMFQIFEAWAQHGITISTDINTTLKLIEFPGPSKKFFYVWDVEWLRGQQRIFDIYNKVYNNKDIKIIARCENHAKLIENNFNNKVAGIVPEFDIKTLQKVISL